MISKAFKTSIILSFVLILIILGLVVSELKSVEAQSVEYDLVGWLWSENYGWISLSSKNCETIFSQDPSEIACAGGGGGGARVAYQVSVSGDDYVTGYGWSDVGWICFGSTCTGSTPDGSALNAILDSDTKKISGWAQIMSLGSDGWIHLRRGVDTGGVTAGQMCYDCQPTCIRMSQSCSMVGDPPAEVCVDSEPCLEYSKTDYDSCNTCFSETYFNGEDLPPTAVNTVAGGSGYTCSNCKGNGITDDDDEFCHETSLIQGASKVYCSNCSSCELYGVNSDSSTGDLLGWAWNGNGVETLGAGWIHFNTDWGPGIIYPWLETRYGAIFSQNNIRQKTGSVANNATYCIFGDNVENISSFNCNQNFIPGVDITFPNSDSNNGVYYNALGKIDVTGIVTPIYGTISKNKFNNTVGLLNSQTLDSWNGEKILNDMVYLSDGDLVIDDSLTFQNGSGSQKGNGTIVVRGDLFINADIGYQFDKPETLSQLASVAWIVEGDVIVDPSVNSIVGAYVLLGNGSGCNGDDPDYPRYEQTGCGVFYSGAGENSLTVSGLIVARAFDLRRIYADINRGSERIIYDGRLAANPSPGLLGFVEGLPVIRDFVY